MAGRRISAAQVRSVLFGDDVDGVRVVRQARRLTADDSAELVLLDARGTWWVARRAGSTVSVWVYIGDAEAEVGFEQLAVAADDGDDAWREAAASMLE